MPRDSRPAGMRLFGVTISPAPDADPLDRDSSPNPPVKDDVIRKSKSMGNLAAAAATTAAASGEGFAAGDGYLSDGGLLQSSRKRQRAQERKKAVPWTEEEHRTFLAGLEKLGKGDWRGIAKNFVTTRTPTQVASHAQKYFLRQSNPNKKKRRSSLFDMMASDLSPAPNCPILPPSMAKLHEMVVMTQQLKNSNLEGVSSSNTADVAPHVVRNLPPVPPFKAMNVDASFSKTDHMRHFSRSPLPFRPIPRIAEGTTSPTLATVNVATPTIQANLTECTTSFLRLQSDLLPLPPPKADPPAEKKDLELMIAPPSQHAMTKISSQNAVLGTGISITATGCK